MEIFLTLLGKLIPLYLVIVLGFVAGRFLKVQRESVAKLAIYIFSPSVVFYGIYKASLSVELILLPIIFLGVCSVLALLFWWVGKKFFNDRTENILAYTAGDGNTGYFGLPVSLAIFGADAISLTILCSFGFILYESTLGYYIIARSHFSVKESIIRFLKLPALYAFILGLIFNVAQLPIGQNFTGLFEQFKACYSIIGMSIIGLGLSTVVRASFDWRLISLAFIAKFLFWPAFIFGLIYIDSNFLHWYDQLTHNVMILMAIVPLAANTVTFASELKVHPEKAAIAVLLSTVFALFFIPLVSVFAF